MCTRVFWSDNNLAKVVSPYDDFDVTARLTPAALTY
jgi:hypothetical protein